MVYYKRHFNHGKTSHQLIKKGTLRKGFSIYFFNRSKPNPNLYWLRHYLSWMVYAKVRYWFRKSGSPKKVFAANGGLHKFFTLPTIHMASWERYVEFVNRSIKSKILHE